MNEGKWVDPARVRYSRRAYQVWQPSGCLMHEYKQKEFVACLQSKRLVFIGDSTTRQIFWAAAKKLDDDGARDDMIAARKHADLAFRRHGVDLEFIWDPYLNSSRLYEELEAYRSTPYAPAEKGDKKRESPAIILVGGGLWFARHVHVNTLGEFQDSIDSILPYMIPPTKAPFAIDPRSFVRNHVSKNLLLMAPVQVPRYDFLSPSRSETITAEKIDAMNDYLQQLSEFQGADVVWSFHLMTRRQRAAYEQSGLHVVDNVAGRKADVLLNLRCNAEAANDKGYPYDRTCCSNYRRPGWVQWAGLFGTLVILPLLVWVSNIGPYTGRTLGHAL
jgi:N-acetylneuraminate 9-O-acetyltransferase